MYFRIIHFFLVHHNVCDRAINIVSHHPNMTTEKYSISFGGFKEHVSSTLDKSLIFSNFTDVTLVSDDNKQFYAHKMVLSASSPVLSEIFSIHPTQEHSVFFRNVYYKVLKALIDFMYLGNVNISQESSSAWRTSVK